MKQFQERITEGSNCYAFEGPEIVNSFIPGNSLIPGYWTIETNIVDSDNYQFMIVVGYLSKHHPIFEMMKLPLPLGRIQVPGASDLSSTFNFGAHVRLCPCIAL